MRLPFSPSFDFASTTRGMTDGLLSPTSGATPGAGALLPAAGGPALMPSAGKSCPGPPAPHASGTLRAASHETSVLLTGRASSRLGACTDFLGEGSLQRRPGPTAAEKPGARVRPVQMTLSRPAGRYTGHGCQRNPGTG